MSFNFNNFSVSAYFHKMQISMRRIKINNQHGESLWSPVACCHADVWLGDRVANLTINDWDTEHEAENEHTRDYWDNIVHG
jgi:hypothetical protein